MRLEKALNDLSKAARLQAEDELVRLASLSALTFQAVENFRTEARLDRECWTSLLKTLLASSSADTCVQITNILRVHTLCGPIISPVPRIRFGRAVTLKRFCHLLVTLGHYATINSAQRAVRHMIDQPIRNLLKYWHHIELGRYLLWSTFNPDALDQPFEDIDGTADKIRGVLGLDRNEAELPLLLFEYEIPSRIQVRFPTIAEAYSSGVWPYFFRPAPLGSQYGMTMPWPEFEHLPPRPEVVHEVMSISFIKSPIRKVE